MRGCQLRLFYFCFISIKKFLIMTNHERRLYDRSDVVVVTGQADLSWRMRVAARSLAPSMPHGCSHRV